MMKTAVSTDSAGLEISPGLIELTMSYNIIITIIVYLYFDVYKSCIPITSITSEIGT